MEDALRDSAPEDLKVIETLRWDKGRGFVRLDRHLSRCAATCRRLGVPFDEVAIRQALERSVTYDRSRIRLTLDLHGCIAVTASDLSEQRAASIWRLGLAQQRLNSGDPWLRIKTTKREIYDRARQHLPANIDEIMFANENDEICEGTITNLFFDFGSGLVTPPVSCGVLPGVLRDELLARGTCRERVIPLSELSAAHAVWAGNSVRGLIRAKLELSVPAL